MAAGTSATLTWDNGTSAFGGTLQNSGAGVTLTPIEPGTGRLTLNGANLSTGGTTSRIT